ncbi:MAG: hypothetical protein QXS54_06035 [Candidatus Methanomethylicaceae archaeon]
MEDNGFSTTVDLGLSVTAQVLEEILTVEKIPPDVMYLETSLFPERVRPGSDIKDYIFVKVRSKEEENEVIDNIKKAYKIYEVLHKTNNTIYYVGNFFLNARRMQSVFTIYPDTYEEIQRYCFSKITWKLSDIYNALNDQMTSNSTSKETKISDSPYQAAFPIKSASVNERKEKDDELIINTVLFHKMFHELGLKRYKKSFLWCIPILGSSYKAEGKLLGIGAVFIITAYKNEVQIPSRTASYLSLKISYLLKDLFISNLYGSVMHNMLLLRRSFIKSAIAAIMSRNMSHNIGSHVLSRLTSGVINGWTGQTSVEDIIEQLYEENCKDSARSLIYWSKDTQILSRYLQHRMDFIAQISTEWPNWSKPTWFMRDMMHWFLSQKHLLDNIARSDGLKAHLYEQSSTGATSTACSPRSSAASPAPGSPTQGDADGAQANQTQNAAGASQQEEKLGDIRLHVFLVPKDCWDETCESSGDRVRARRDQIKSGCTKEADQLPCKRDRDGSGQPCEHCHRILLYTSKDSVECCLEEDFQVAIPGGIVGQHAFFTILENIIRNAAKHGYSQQRDQFDHLDVVIEVLYDPEEKVAIRNQVDDQTKRIPAWLFRIYTNVSPVDGSSAVVSVDKINEILGKGIIKETGELEKANWGHAEMKIAVGYLQRRDIMHIGEQGQEITGESGKTMLELGGSENGSRAIIRAVASPIGTLGYEFYIPRPRTVGIVCPKGGAP